MMGPRRSKIVSKTTIKTIQSDLDLMNNRYRELRTDFRAGLYGLMAQAARVILILRRNEQLRKKFRKSVMDAQPKTSRSNFDLSTEVFAHVMGAHSRVGRQKAWKRARVIDALLDDGVPIEKIARTIKKRGGVERICRETAASLNRRDKVPERKLDLSPSNRKAEETPPRKIGFRSNDGEASITLRIRLSDRDDLLDARAGSKIKIVALRVGGGDTDFKVTRAKIIRTADISSKDEDKEDAEWDLA